MSSTPTRLAAVFTATIAAACAPQAAAPAPAPPPDTRPLSLEGPGEAALRRTVTDLRAALRPLMGEVDVVQYELPGEARIETAVRHYSARAKATHRTPDARLAPNQPGFKAWAWRGDGRASAFAIAYVDAPPNGTVDVLFVAVPRKSGS